MSTVPRGDAAAGCGRNEKYTASGVRGGALCEDTAS